MMDVDVEIYCKNFKKSDKDHVNFHYVESQYEWFNKNKDKKIPLIKAEEYFSFKLQLISFFIKFEPEDKINVSETLLCACSILLNEYLILLFSS